GPSSSRHSKRAVRNAVAGHALSRRWHDPVREHAQGLAPMSLVAKFASVGSATMASRVLGFAREALIAAALGAGPVTDAFYAAFRFPNLFRRLFAEGAFNTAFIPLFAKEMEGGGRDAARRFAEDVLA